MRLFYFVPQLTAFLNTQYFDEEEEVEVALSESEDEDSEKIYNPLKLPLGWDGKPIPYWLYKLHGLGVEYPCEICGGFVYMGRKAFDRHFQVRTFCDLSVCGWFQLLFF